MFNVTKQEIKTNPCSSSPGISLAEDNISAFFRESERVDNEAIRVRLMQKKQAWLKVDAQQEYIDSLTKTRHSLLDQETSNNDHLTERLRQVTERISRAKAQLSIFRSKAEEIAPKSLWRERLSKDDLPSDLGALSDELEESMSNLLSMEAAWASSERRMSISAFQAGLEALFESVGVSLSREKKRALEESEEEGRKRKKSGPEEKNDQPRKGFAFGMPASAGAATYFAGAGAFGSHPAVG